MEKIMCTPPEELADLAGEFLENRRADFKKMMMLHKADDIEALEKMAHTIKGMGSSYGFDHMTTLAEKLMIFCREHKRELVDLFMAEFEWYLEHLEVQSDEMEEI